MTKRITLSLLIIFAITVSSTGVADKASDQYLDEALIAGGLVYATARGINAAVSVVQGTELDAAIASFTVGEVLDPLNDLIERFSAVLLVALGSLALQKILLEIVSSSQFSYIVLSIGLATLASMWLQWCSPARATLVRLFTITIIARFALTLAVLASGFVDHIFLQDQNEVRHASMQDLQGSVQRLSAGKPEAPPPELVKMQQERTKMAEAEAGRLQAEINSLNVELSQKNAEIEVIHDRLPLGCPINPLCLKGRHLERLERDKQILEMTVATRTTELENNKRRRRELREELECLLKQQNGHSCSAWPLTPYAIKERIDALADRVTVFAANAVALLMSLIIKTVLVPLFFLWGLVLLSRQWIGTVR